MTIRPFTLAPLAAGLAMIVPLPVLAQDEGGDSVNMVIIYGEDDCPASQGNEIVVCRRLDEGERYRIPEELRTSDSPQNEAWTSRVKSYEVVGNFGTLSCTPSGAGGELGCTQGLINAAYAEKKQSSDGRFSQLIEEERQKRLATIDEDAAAEQARVEELEREYMARLEAERSGETAAESPPADTPATPHGE